MAAKKDAPPARRNATKTDATKTDIGMKANAMTINVDVNVVGTALQETLVELTDLHLRAKQAHWNVVGRHFRSLHLELDELTGEVRTAADLVAERAVAIGYPPDGRPGTVAKSTPVPEFPAGRVLDGEVIEMVTDALAEVCRHVRVRLEQTEDLVTQDLLADTLAMLEKHHWMFAAQRVPASRA
jgi:starvation-inducible DNA-binding protein